MSIEPEQVSSEEVAGLLSGVPTADNPIGLDLKAEELGLAAAEVKEKAEKTTVPPDPAYAEGDTSAKLITEMLRMPKIEEHHLHMTPAEKDIYIKALMFDAALELSIELPGIKAQVLIRSRSNFDQLMVVQATQRDAEEKLITDFTSHTTRGMQYSAMCQLLRFGPAVSPHVDFDGTETQDQAIAKMRAVLPHYQKMNSVKWAACLTALQIFEGKLALASSNVLNRDFFQPAG